MKKKVIKKQTSKQVNLHSKEDKLPQIQLPPIIDLEKIVALELRDAMKDIVIAEQTLKMNEMNFESARKKYATMLFKIADDLGIKNIEQYRFDHINNRFVRGDLPIEQIPPKPRNEQVKEQ